MLALLFDMLTIKTFLVKLLLFVEYLNVSIFEKWLTVYRWNISWTFFRKSVSTRHVYFIVRYDGVHIYNKVYIIEFSMNWNNDDKERMNDDEVVIYCMQTPKIET